MAPTSLHSILVRMISIFQKPTFRKSYKKVSRKEKQVVDEAIQAIAKDPKKEQLKKGDLSGLSVYKFKINKQEKLLAYAFNNTRILLASFGTYENFYRDLKKTIV